MEVCVARTPKMVSYYHVSKMEAMLLGYQDSSLLLALYAHVFKMFLFFQDGILVITFQRANIQAHTVWANKKSMEGLNHGG